jgi:RNA polymerase sigma-70 factor, ECF subfamily
VVAHAHTVFDALYAANRNTLHAYLLGRTGDPELALDLLQDVFVRAWRSIVSLDGLTPERQRAWLVTVARHLAVDHYRSQATRRKAVEALERETRLANATARPADLEVDERQRLLRLDAAIRDLPEDLRIVLVLAVLDERTSTEIGELLARPAGTVRYQLAQARRLLARDVLQCGDP